MPSAWTAGKSRPTWPHYPGWFSTPLRALQEVIYALGGEKAIAATFRAIQDVGRWWP